MKHLIDLPLEMVAAACRRLVDKREFFPSISRIRSEAGAMLDQKARDEAEARRVKEAHRLEAFTGPPSKETKQRARKLVDDLCERCKLPGDEGKEKT